MTSNFYLLLLIRKTFEVFVITLFLNFLRLHFKSYSWLLISFLHTFDYVFYFIVFPLHLSFLLIFLMFTVVYSCVCLFWLITLTFRELIHDKTFSKFLDFINDENLHYRRVLHGQLFI